MIKALEEEERAKKQAADIEAQQGDGRGGSA